jgi:aromatic ring-opening dioxygenase catalytic subunit (LigB family)
LNWNVYKVFNNGKRAKALMLTFKHKGQLEEATHYFNENIKKNFNEKNRELNFVLLRGDVPQEREEKKIEENFHFQTMILGAMAKKLDLEKKQRVVGGLLFASTTHWKWQWCALESGTHNYIAGLSPRFDNASEADRWMEQQVQNLK